MAATSRLPFARRWRYRLEAVVLFSLMRFFNLFDVDTASAIGGWLGRNVIMRIARRDVGRANMLTAFPELTSVELGELRDGFWDNLGRVGAELAHVAAFSGTAGHRIRLVGTENILAARERGKGVIIVSGHFANWELIPVALRNAGIDGTFVVRPPNNIHTVKWLAGVRTRYGFTRQVAKGRRETIKLLTRLRRGECVLLLVDQALAEGIAVPFFGRMAMTAVTPAALALLLDAEIVPVSLRRTGGAHFELVVHPPLDLPATGDDQADRRAVTAAINAFLEGVIRRSPAHWLWMHDRWHMPRDAAEGPVAPQSGESSRPPS